MFDQLTIHTYKEKERNGLSSKQRMCEVEVVRNHYIIAME